MGNQCGCDGVEDHEKQKNGNIESGMFARKKDIVKGKSKDRNKKDKSPSNYKVYESSQSEENRVDFDN